MTPNVIDISSWQKSHEIDFKTMYNNGIKGIIIKLTEGSEDGSAYVNPEATAQIAGASSAGMSLNFYHFFHGCGRQDSINEALWFIKIAQRYNVPKDSVMVCDVESPSNSLDRAQLTADINVFLQTLKDHGYNNVDTYANLSWFTKRINVPQLISANIWLAEYPANPVRPSMPCGLWQYASDGRVAGYNGDIDVNIDYNGFYLYHHMTEGTPEVTPPVTPPTPNTGNTYIVQAGDSLSLIGEITRFDWKTIAQVNGITDPYIIQPGQVLTLPGSTAGNTVDGTYIVKSGDNLSTIANNLNTSVDAIAKLNGISNPDLITVGQVLRIPGGTHNIANNVYVVQSGDNLSSIGERNGIPWQTLAAKNNITGPDYVIHPGQKINL